MDASKDLPDFVSIDYIPQSGRNKGQLITVIYKGHNRDQIAWLKDVAFKKKNKLVKLEKVGTYWEGFPLNNLTKEGGVRFPNGKKPEELIRKVMELSTKENDLVLDSFLGSGTTAAVAHKMGRRYIGIEMGDHAMTHCVPRLQKVIEGEQGGISKTVSWQGGGGFRFYTLGEPIFDADGNINPAIRFDALAAHIWFCETKTAWGKSKGKGPFLGVHNGVAYYLLYNGILGDKTVNGGNVLTMPLLKTLPVHEGEKVIYGETSRISQTRLKALNIIFKQTPYDVKAR